MTLYRHGGTEARRHEGAKAGRLPLRASILLCLLFSGCIANPSNPAATQPATSVDREQATAEYWLDQPGVMSVQWADYAALWNAAERAARDDLFTIDRRDYREGVLTTDPLISKQFFELWRDDAVTAYGVTRSSLQTIRRSIHFIFVRDSGGGWTVTPKVLVEQFATAGRHVTYVGAYQSFSAPGGQYGSVEADEGIYLPAQYWYAIGRDHALERKLAEQIRKVLR